MTKPSLHSGNHVPKSGQYEIVWPRGGETPYGEITGVRGKPLPPTPEPGLGYVLVDATNQGKK